MAHLRRNLGRQQRGCRVLPPPYNRSHRIREDYISIEVILARLHLPMDARRFRRVLLVVTCAGMMVGCAPSDPRRALESFDPQRRIDAVKMVRTSRDMTLIPALVDRLDDEDVAVRMAAILALEKMTEKRLGYSAWAELSDRRAAVNRWREFLANRAATLQTVAGQPSQAAVSSGRSGDVMRSATKVPLSP